MRRVEGTNLLTCKIKKLVSRRKKGVERIFLTELEEFEKEIGRTKL